MSESPVWLRLLFALFALAALWGGFELIRLDQGGTAALRTACLEGNRAALAEAARASGAGETAAAVAALVRVADCPALPAWPWALLAGGFAGLGVALVLREVTVRLARLEAGPAPVAVGAPIPPPVRRGGAPPVVEPPPAAREAAPLAEDDPRVRMVTEEMRAQGLNISPEVARHVAALRTPRAEG